MYLCFKVYICLLVFLSLNLAHSALLNKDLYRLDIIHYNDFHDRFEETTALYPVCDSNNNDCLGGFARLYYEIHALLKEKNNALLLNAGDTFQGTYWYTLMKWNITQKFINLLPNDVHTIGNHEFDGGVAGLAPYLAALRAPVVVANIDTSAEPGLGSLYKSHVILEKKGRKIGIIGLTTPETRTTSNSEDVKFLDPVTTTKKEVELLTKQGVDIIIVLSHCGLEVDKKIAKTVGENLDIIVGGHSHSLLWNGKAPTKEHVSGTYPIVITPDANPDHKVLVVSAASFSKYLGNMTVFFDRKGDIVDYFGTPVFLNRSIPEDPEIKALLKPYTEKLHSLVREVVGYANEDLLDSKCSSQECAVGNLVADAFLDATKELKLSNLTHVSFILRDMVRGSLSKGEITRGAIINTLPFTNKVVTFALPGRYLRHIFKICMTNYYVAKPFNGPWMPHVAGLRLTINLTQGVDVVAQVKEGGEFKDLDPDREYQVSTLGFLLRSRNNAFEVLRRYGRNIRAVGKDSDVLESFIRRTSPLTPVLNNRLTVIN
ncbi:unnamed protein product [Parnassius apollo]|uniref:(apollo) hypothetical protein n=1 Tax=Parnassius apollo TaxID=110799 RepID=A0A8S3XFM9_PARAO|nr:unnamed protein product [Parnassius apollo]